MTTAVPERTAPTPPTRGRRGRSFLGWVGIGMLLSGLAVLGYVAWQMIGTNVVAQQRAEKITQQTEQAWAKGYDGPALGIVHVPRFGTKYAVPIIKGFGDAQLAKGIAWYPKGAEPGQRGNFVLAAHRVTHGEPFAKFPSLERGDLVLIETRTATYTYRLRNPGTSRIVDFTASWPLYPVPDPSAATTKPTKKLITLLTCSELFHTDKRSVVIGQLIRTTPRRTTTKAAG